MILRSSAAISVCVPDTCGLFAVAAARHCDEQCSYHELDVPPCHYRLGLSLCLRDHSEPSQASTFACQLRSADCLVMIGASALLRQQWWAGSMLLARHAAARQALHCCCDLGLDLAAVRRVVRSRDGVEPKVLGGSASTRVHSTSVRIAHSNSDCPVFRDHDDSSDAMSRRSASGQPLTSSQRQQGAAAAAPSGRADFRFSSPPGWCSTARPCRSAGRGGRTRAARCRWRPPGRRWRRT